MTDLPPPPVAAARPHAVVSPNGTRQDEYYWLRDDSRSDPQVLAHLQAENAWTDRALAHLQPLRERLYAEMTGRLRQDDASVPAPKGAYDYYHRYEAGREYPLYLRRRRVAGAPEELLLDVNARASGHAQCVIGALAVSPDARRLAWAEDRVGRNQYTLRVRDLDTGRELAFERANVEPEVMWADDSRTLFFIEKDPVTLLGRRVWRHTLGQEDAAGADTLVFEQEDESFYTSLSRSKDERYLLIHTQSTVSGECWFAPGDDPGFRFRLFLARERDHEYQVDHAGSAWIVRTNWHARNFRIMRVPHGAEAERGLWRDVLPQRSDALVDGFDVFRDCLAVEEHSQGLRRVRLRPWSGGPDVLLDAGEAAASCQLDVNREFHARAVRFSFTSLTTPLTVCEHDLATGAQRVLKREPVEGGYDAAHYAGARIAIRARDGASVPVTLAWHRDTPRDGSAPLLQIGYGAYGIANDPEFSRSLPSLLDRGFIVAIAHVRGGQELGRDWYDQGRLLCKANTFRDFIDVTRGLVVQRWCHPRRVCATGRSAGGLLMGVIANEAPGDYRAIVSGVPFVDVVTTMLDESIPLTTNEYDEWGDPREPAHYANMLAYSPYDNLGHHDYPALYVFAGLWDSQVQYFEPAKYVARLRARRTGDTLVVLRINMEAGHGGHTGRFRHYLERAEEYAFLLDQVGVVAPAATAANPDTATPN